MRKLLARFRQLNRSVWLAFSSLCFGVILIALNPIEPARPIDQGVTPTSPAAPTATPATQSGNGSNIFQLYCMPCHGDLGQGLTDEFRFRQYPPEDTNCWKSGCHGDRPYENGFTLPKTIPAVIGAGTLVRFSTAQDLYAFMRAAMPFNAPGSLTEAQYTQLLAYILSSNQRAPADAQLDVNTLAQIRLHDGSIAPTPEPPATPTPREMPTAFWGILIFLIIATVLSIITRRRK